MTSRYRLGVDVGGTFTDAVLISESTGDIQIAKVPSTPADPSLGFLDAVASILASTALAAADASYVVHGTTVATNCLIEGKTPRTAFLTTEGFRDMLEIGRQIRPSLYDVHFEKPKPLVPRDLCFEVPERLDASGKVLHALNVDSTRRVLEALVKEKVASVAVCLLHSYLNPEHEETVGALLREIQPELQVSLSSKICPEFREYFRASTTVINACIRPIVERYLRGIKQRLADRGMAAELLIMQSNGGVLTSESASERPVFLVESGPAAGVVAANFVAADLGYKNVLSFDMGGTTAKVGLILDGQAKVTKEYEVGVRAQAGMGQARGLGYPIRTPVIDLVEIGAGGGSIAWVDSGNVLRVGPRSAGADPGPISYGKGGAEPTITDANIVLGRINPDYFLGGKMGLDSGSARKGLARCGQPLGLDPVATANGIVEIANAEMTNAVRIVTVRRGYDPRELVMVAFGGAGPLHANRLCAEMQIPLLIIPPSPGTTSALGLLVTDLKHEFSRTRIMPAGKADVVEINRIFGAMREEGKAILAREGIGEKDSRFLRHVEMRYIGQSYELAVELPEGTITPQTLAAACAAFHSEHDRTYGHGYPEQPVEFVNFRLTAVGVIARPAFRELPPAHGRAEDARKQPRKVFFSEADGFVETAVYDRGLLGPGHRFEGPAIVEEMDSTSLIHPGYQVEVDRFGNLLVSPIAAASPTPS